MRIKSIIRPKKARRNSIALLQPKKSKAIHSKAGKMFKKIKYSSINLELVMGTSYGPSLLKSRLLD